MTWGTDFTAEIFLSRQTFSRKYEVEIRIEELVELINECEALLKMYASATPNNIVPPEEESIEWLNTRINEELSMYQDYIINRYNLTLYLDYLGENEDIKNEETDV